jgi:hypothetical protein
MGEKEARIEIDMKWNCMRKIKKSERILQDSDLKKQPSAVKRFCTLAKLMRSLQIIMLRKVLRNRQVSTSSPFTPGLDSVI